MTSVKVGLRIRPLLQREKNQAISLNACDTTTADFKGTSFTFDHVFGVDVSQQQLYSETAAPMLQSFIEGYNVTLMAYGQTGSGS
jgi:kinesin family protein 4/21/27